VYEQGHSVQFSPGVVLTYASAVALTILPHAFQIFFLQPHPEGRAVLYTIFSHQKLWKQDVDYL